MLRDSSFLKEDAGWEDYDLDLQLLLSAEFWQLDAGDACIITIGSPEWQLRESHSLKRPQNRRQGIRVKTAWGILPKDRVATKLTAKY